MNDAVPAPSPARSPGSVRAAKLVVVLLALIGTDQLVNQIALSDGWFLGKRIAPFDPPIFTQQQQESLDRLRDLAAGGAPTGVVRFDSEIGWASPTNELAGGSWYDEFGARRTSRDEVTPEVAARPKLALIGCSFTHGDEVAANETWGHALQSQGKWNVSNLGVGGYGIDQAQLLFARIGPRLKPEVVVLGILPKAIPRLYSVYRPAMRHQEPSVSFKPCFFRSGDLTPCENPARTPAEAVEILTTPGRFWEAVGPHDTYVQRHPSCYARMGSHVSHRFAITRLWLTFNESRTNPVFDTTALATIPDSFELPAQCVFRILATAQQIGAKVQVVIFPDADDLAHHVRGKPSLPLLRGWLQEQGLLLCEIEPALLQAGVRSGREFFAPGGHYMARTNQIVAQQIAAALR